MRLILALAALPLLTSCAALTSALAVAQPIVGAVCLADGFTPIARAPVPWADPRAVDALIALAEVDRLTRAPSATPAQMDAARGVLAGQLAALPPGTPAP